MSQCHLISKKFLLYIFICLVGVIVHLEHLHTQQKTNKTVAEGVSLSVSAGWNLLSLPASVTNGNKATLFPGAISPAYVFDNVNGYQSLDTLTKGIGFWVKFGSPDTILIPGNASFSDTITLTEGWNIIGALAVALPVDSIQSTPSGIFASPFYEFIPGAGYQQVDTLHPGRGYWVKTSQSGTILSKGNGIIYGDSTQFPESLPDFQNVSVDSSELIFTYSSSGAVPSFFPGQILAGNSDGGYARKVVSTIQNGSQLIVETENASFDEVVDYAQMDTSFDFHFPEELTLRRMLSKPIYSEKTSDGVHYTITGDIPAVSVSVDSRILTLNIPNVQIQTSSGSGQASVSVDMLTLTLDASVQSFDLVFNLGLERFLFETQLRPTITFSNYKATFTGNLTNLTQEITLFQSPLTIIPTPIVGLVLVPEFNLKLGLNTTMGVTATSSIEDNIQAALTINTGVEYSDSDFTTSWNVEADGSISPKTALAGNITFGQNYFLKPSIDVTINRIVGLGVNTKPYIYGQITAPPFAAEMGGGISAGISAKFNIFSRTILEHEFTFTDIKYKWWEQHGPNIPSNPHPVDGDTAGGIAPTLTWSSSDPDGDLVDYTVYFGTTNPPTNPISTQTDSSYALDTLVSGASYWWKIVAVDTATGFYTEGPGWTFRAGEIPTAPSLVFPTNSAEELAVPLTFRWRKIATATSYKLQISTENSFTNIIWIQSGITDTSAQVDGLEQFTTFFWRVSAINELGESAPSSVRSFTTAPVDPPSAPQLLQPTNGNTVQPYSISLLWRSDTLASSYELQVSTSAAFSSFVINENELIDTNFSSSNLLGSTTYFWRVNAMNSVGVSDWSETRSFMTDTLLPPGPFTLISPANGDTGISTVTQFVWTRSNHATVYNVLIYPDNDTVNPVVLGNIYGDTMVNVDYTLLSSTRYRCKITASNLAGIRHSQVNIITTPIGYGTACPGLPTITYDGKTYNTVKIGRHCWLRENLNVGTMIYSDSNQRGWGPYTIIEKYCYNDESSNCNIYGGLYQPNEAMDYAPGTGTPGGKIKGICPQGWHLPREAAGGINELFDLTQTVFNGANALKKVGVGSGAGVGTNISGFSALLGGFSDFSGIGEEGRFLTAGYNVSGHRYVGYFNVRKDNNVINGNSSSLELSVRCVKD